MSVSLGAFQPMVVEKSRLHPKPPILASMSANARSRRASFVVVLDEDILRALDASCLHDVGLLRL